MQLNSCIRRFIFVIRNVFVTLCIRYTSIDYRIFVFFMGGGMGNYDMIPPDNLNMSVVNRTSTFDIHYINDRSLNYLNFVHPTRLLVVFVCFMWLVGFVFCFLFFVWLFVFVCLFVLFVVVCLFGGECSFLVCVFYDSHTLKERKKMLYLTMHSTHFTYSNTASDIWSGYT